MTNKICVLSLVIPCRGMLIHFVLISKIYKQNSCYVSTKIIERKASNCEIWYIYIYYILMMWIKLRQHNVSTEWSVIKASSWQSHVKINYNAMIIT